MKSIYLAIGSLALFTQPAFAQGDDTRSEADDKAGVRIEGRVLWERINDPVEDLNISYELDSGVGFGGEVGFDVAVSDKIVVGPYARYEASTLESCEGALCISSGGNWAAGVHVGLVVDDNGLAYAKLGYSQLNVKLEGPFFDPNSNTTFLFDESETGGGYDFALGYEHGFGDTIYARGEIGISETYDIYGFDFQRGSIALAVGARF